LANFPAGAGLFSGLDPGGGPSVYLLPTAAAAAPPKSGEATELCPAQGQLPEEQTFRYVEL